MIHVQGWEKGLYNMLRRKDENTKESVRLGGGNEQSKGNSLDGKLYMCNVVCVARRGGEFGFSSLSF